MPRIVADTNIYISALNFAGTADKVLALGRAGLIEICLPGDSRRDRRRAGGVLARRFRWSATRVREARSAISGFTVAVHPREPVSVILEDEADNRGPALAGPRQWQGAGGVPPVPELDRRDEARRRACIAWRSRPAVV